MYKKKTINWEDPDNFISSIDLEEHDTFFYCKSAENKFRRNSKSIIGLYSTETIESNNFRASLDKLIVSDTENFILSLLPYEYMSQIDDHFNICDNSFISFSKAVFIKFALIFSFDHDIKKLDMFYLDHDYIDKFDKLKINNPLRHKKLKVKNISSNFTSDEYINTIGKIKISIENGDYYQTNLTRKFFGELSNNPSTLDKLQSYIKLTNISPANYSSFVKYNNRIIICNSPELYLRVDDGRVKSTPIKGTAPRSKFLLDSYYKNKLKNSKKEMAENLMIVDLVRNDLSAVSVPTSIVVDKLFKVDSYPSYHHLSTLIKSTLRNDKTILDLLSSSFPPGSMTGAPKIAAVNNVAIHEKYRRGIYGGSIGLINGYKDAIFNVVIRTILVENNKFEFQVGGAITYDSSPKKELEEIFIKSKSICKILGIKNIKNVN